MKIQNLYKVTRPVVDVEVLLTQYSNLYPSPETWPEDELLCPKNKPANQPCDRSVDKPFRYH